ncbi:hypothetical protein QAD02_005283 [Eretmocerus hayati]|uniref:Uncharacterized protein n=1 Tax=Eretmocerus hayati TaxID=131215 RepID=A0ACC2NTT7_9HYME|nr:hypothetical protein QAD02_005283 [Eretmocerus hayati]
MKSIVTNLIITLLSMMNFQAAKANEDILMDYMFNYIQNVSSPYKVNVFSETLDGLSTLANKIVQRVNRDFPSNNLDRILASKMIEWAAADTFDSVLYNFKRVPERVSLAVGVIDSKNISQTSAEMEDMLEYFDASNRYTRGKYLINIVTSERFSFRNVSEEFFRRAWQRKFIDLTVIEWIQEEQVEKGNIFPNCRTTHNEALVYSYNIFTGSLRSEILTVQTDLFPEKMKNLNGFLLYISVGRLESSSVERETDLALFKTMVENLNGSVRIKKGEEESSPKPNDDPYSYAAELPFLENNRILLHREANNYSHLEWEFTLDHYLLSVYIPAQYTFNFHLMRPKTHKIKVLPAAIVTFSVLILTAFTFHVWARILGFRRPNWSFLNILTVQMGGSIAHQGPMKLSEKIFQMSIYIATFIVVTVGTDYVLQNFVSIPTLTEVRTIQDLADLDIDLIVDHTTHEDFRPEHYLWIGSDPVVRKIVDRFKPVNYATEFHHSFCQRPTSNSLTLDESINLCITKSYSENHVMMSDDKYQIDNIQEPIVSVAPVILSSSFPPLFTSRLQDVVYRFLEVGIIKIWEESTMKYRNLIPMMSNEAPSQKESKDSERQLKKQLLAIFVIGCSLSIVALICELFWKTFIDKTQFASLARAFFCDYHSSFGDRMPRTNHATTSESQMRLKIVNHPGSPQKPLRGSTIYPASPPSISEGSRLADSLLQDRSCVIGRPKLSTKIYTNTAGTSGCRQITIIDDQATN